MEEKKKVGAMQVVLFSLSGEEFAFNINRINEIIRVQPYTKIPATESYVEGMMNFRGKIISVIYLNLKLGFEKNPDTDNTRIVVVELDNDDMVGFRVDSVSEVLKVQEGEIRPAPSVITNRVDSSYIKGIVIMGERLVIVLNASKILSAHETDALAQGIKSHETEILDDAKKESPLPVDDPLDEPKLLDESLQKPDVVAKENEADEPVEDAEVVKPQVSPPAEPALTPIPHTEDNHELLHIGKGAASTAPIDEKEYFWFNDGHSASNINELKEKLSGMSDDAFSQHVNDSKNDFEKWIRHVMKDEMLADKLKDLHKKEDILAALG